MTIKQQGGIFGRNPTFNDLTVEGTVSVPNNSISGNAIDGGSADLDGLTVNGDFEVSSNLPKITFTEEDDGTRTELTQNFGYFTINADAGDQKAGDGIIFKVDDAEAARFNSSLNLAFPSGQGIDFSATSGTGTSELFDDYEEGTWTPAQGSGVTVTGSFASSGKYTKVGRVVTLIGQMSGSTNIAVSAGSELTPTLPFTPEGTSVSVGSLTTGAVSQSNSVAVSYFGPKIFCMEAITTTASAIHFTVTYFTS